MEEALPKLRWDLDIMPSPIPERPGLLMRDPFRYTETVIVVPPAWIPVLRCLDGDHSERDAQVLLTRQSGGRIAPIEQVRQIVGVLRESGFLETEELEAMKAERHEVFRRAPRRTPAHAGSAYPASAVEIEQAFGRRLPASPGGEARGMPRAIVAPHVSPEGGFDSYRFAYDVVPPESEELTFVILGTSHYGAPERVGVTRKPFETPLGVVPVATEHVDAIVSRAGDGVLEEDYCHAPEHSIELQVVFLQHRFRRPFRIVPLLVGPFADSLVSGRRPEALDVNRRVFDALSDLALSAPELHWILGVDMAHVGPRYGQDGTMRAGEGPMRAVAEADRARIERLRSRDAEGFFELVHPEGDALHWCGYAPLYAFLHAVAPVLDLEGDLLHYEQWNIDPASVVTFAAMHFDPRTRG